MLDLSHTSSPDLFEKIDSALKRAATTIFEAEVCRVMLKKTNPDDLKIEFDKHMAEFSKAEAPMQTWVQKAIAQKVTDVKKQKK